MEDKNNKHAHGDIEKDGMQVMIFTICNEMFGLNIADVLEIMKLLPVTAMQKSSEFIEGVFKPRDKVITVIDLAKYFGLERSDDETHDIFIISNLETQDYAFHVHGVVGMEYIPYSEIKEPDKVLAAGEGVINGITQFGDSLVTILNLSRILTDIVERQDALAEAHGA